MHHVGPGILQQKNLKNVQIQTQTLFDLEYREKNSKTRTMRNAHCRSGNMARKMKNVENETQTLFDLEYSKKTEKPGKCETHMLGP